MLDYTQITDMEYYNFIMSFGMLTDEEKIQRIKDHEEHIEKCRRINAKVEETKRWIESKRREIEEEQKLFDAKYENTKRKIEDAEKCTISASSALRDHMDFVHKNNVRNHMDTVNLTINISLGLM